MLTSDMFMHFLYCTRRFNIAMEQPDGAFLEGELLKLRLTLIQEEMDELAVEIEKAIKEIQEGYLVSSETAMQIMKELADLIYVTAGACATFAIPYAPAVERNVNFDPVFFSDETTHELNLTRLRLSCQSVVSAFVSAYELCQPGGKESPLNIYNRLMTSMSVLTDDIIKYAQDAGIEIVDVFNEVQASNMSKLGEDGHPVYREDGKVLKGPNYKKPDLTRFIESRDDIARV